MFDNDNSRQNDRKHLTGRELEQFVEATRRIRNRASNQCVFLLMFRAGLRVSEGWQKIDRMNTESGSASAFAAAPKSYGTAPLREKCPALSWAIARVHVHSRNCPEFRTRLQTLQVRADDYHPES